MKRKYPICLLGFGIKRWERFNSDADNGTYQTEEYWDHSGFLSFVDRSKTHWGPTHLQKKSRLGFLIQWPLCFHFWIQFRKQKQDNSGNWIPGSECVFYWRFGLWRWDPGMEKFIGPWTWFLGLHWD